MIIICQCVYIYIACYQLPAQKGGDNIFDSFRINLSKLVEKTPGN